MEYTSLAEKIIAHSEEPMRNQLTETLPKTRCTPAMRGALETMAINLECSMSDIVRVAVDQHLTRYHRNAAGQDPAGPPTPASLGDKVEMTGQSHPDSGRRLAS